MFDDDVRPDVTVFGSGDADLAVVGCVHGDEPAGVRAIHRVLRSSPEFRRAVKFVVANPPATAAGRRSLDVDINRVFLGDPDAEARERRLAARLLEETDGCNVLSVYTTHATPEPIGFVSSGHPRALEIASELPLDYVVNERPVVDSAFSDAERVISVEAGKPGHSDATAKAAMIVRAFLEKADAVAASPTRFRNANPDCFEIHDTVEKPPEDRYELLAQNFHRVDEGTTYATAEGEPLVADEPFVPVLMSHSGYPHIFGYRGRKVGERLDEAREAWLDGDG